MLVYAGKIEGGWDEQEKQALLAPGAGVAAPPRSHPRPAGCRDRSREQSRRRRIPR
jgi:hypothetical protein